MDIDLLIKQGYSVSKLCAVTGLGKNKIVAYVQSANYAQYRAWQKQTMIRRIKRLIACNHSDHQIAARLGVSVSKMRTIRRRHINNIGLQQRGVCRELQHKILATIKAHPDYSTSKVARMCGCSRTTVIKYRHMKNDLPNTV